MSNPTGKALQPVIRYLILSDGQLREMRLCFRAKAALEEFLGPAVRDLAQKLGRKPTEEDLKHLDLGMGALNQTAHMAWIFTSRWRRRHEPELAFEEFLDLFPDGDAELEAISESIEAVMPKPAAAEGDDSGNAPEAAP